VSRREHELKDADFPIDRTITKAGVDRTRAQTIQRQRTRSGAALLSGHWLGSILSGNYGYIVPTIIREGQAIRTLSCWGGPEQCSTGWSAYRCRAAALGVAQPVMDLLFPLHLVLSNGDGIEVSLFHPQHP